MAEATEWVTQREFARRTGQSDANVRKLLTNGHLERGSNNRLDYQLNLRLLETYREGRAASDHGGHRPGSGRPRTTGRPAKPSVSGPPDPDDGGPSTREISRQRASAATAKLATEANIAQLRLKQMQNELVEYKKVRQWLFAWCRGERDAWLAFSARYSAQIANELNIDHRTANTILDKYVRRHLAELAKLEPPNVE